MRWREAPATVGIALVTLIVSLGIVFSGWLPWAAVGGGFIPLRLDGSAMPANVVAVPMWLTPLTATLVHAGIVHLGFNLLMMVYCGVQVERAIGTGPTLTLYVAGAYAAAIGQWAMDPGSPVPMIGASGAISALVAGYALLYGRSRARAVGVVPASIVHVAWLAAAWIGIQALIGFAGMGAGSPIAIGAQIGGFLAGLLLVRPMLLWRYRHA